MSHLPGDSATLAAKRAKQTVDPSWNPILAPTQSIEGVRVVEIKNLVIRGGTLTEIYRPEWFDGVMKVEHVTHVTSLPGFQSKWHCHQDQADVIFVLGGYFRAGLFDARTDSPTHGHAFVANLHLMRPQAIYVPPGVWHALRNVGNAEASYIVLNDRPYHYENPDDWILPVGVPDIPISLE